KGRTKRRPPARLNIGATRAAEKFGTTIAELGLKLDSLEEERQLAIQNGRSIERIRAERMKYMTTAKVLSARKKLLEFALKVNFPGKIEEFRLVGIESEEQIRIELGQIELDLKGTGEHVKKLLTQERKGGPLIDPNPDPLVMLANYDSLLTELESDVGLQRAATITAKRSRVPGEAAKSQRTELQMRGGQSVAKIEMLRFLIDHPLLRQSRGIKTKTDAMRMIEEELERLRLTNNTLKVLEKNRRK
ncbi:MAG: hypothetical protein QGI60_04550, partial [archaeon]|nr:hypothetical protein [archaeon]